MHLGLEKTLKIGVVLGSFESELNCEAENFLIFLSFGVAKQILNFLYLLLGYFMIFLKF